MADKPSPISRELEWQEVLHGNEYHFRRKKLAKPAGGHEIGCSLYEIYPGKRCWPYHYHLNNEESLYVIDGEGVLRTPSGEQHIGAGDYIVFETGPNGAHAIRNEGNAILKVLIVSTMHEPDICIYPDQEKMGIYVGKNLPGDNNGDVHQRST